MRAGQKLLHHRPHGGGAQHQGFLARAGVEHAVGEDMAALEIGAELDLVDGEEGDIEIARHGLDGGDPEARIWRLDLLLAGDQRDVLGADAIDHLVVDLARQQPQRQPDHAARMRQHALDGEVGLAGVGRPEHGGDAVAAGTRRSGGLRRKGNRHYRSKCGHTTRPLRVMPARVRLRACALRWIYSRRRSPCGRRRVAGLHVFQPDKRARRGWPGPSRQDGAARLWPGYDWRGSVSQCDDCRVPG